MTVSLLWDIKELVFLFFSPLWSLHPCNWMVTNYLSSISTILPLTSALLLIVTHHWNQATTNKLLVTHNSLMTIFQRLSHSQRWGEIHQFVKDMIIYRYYHMELLVKKKSLVSSSFALDFVRNVFKASKLRGNRILIYNHKCWKVALGQSPKQPLYSFCLHPVRDEMSHQLSNYQGRQTEETPDTPRVSSTLPILLGWSLGYKGTPPPEENIKLRHLQSAVIMLFADFWLR